ncbi:MAG: ribonuclease PH [Dehalococcoidia bacterium]|tara:strand:- start:181 stop:900 length:720 start_codon:yes stop_codon:yes gene_type:complete
MDNVTLFLIYLIMRPIKITPNIISNADGSILYQSGKTEVICTATFESKTPEWLHGGGWITAEYSMLPASTSSRVAREISRGKKSPRSQEIQRLIGRSLRGAVDLNEIPGNSIYIDCDVINADGGTRTASINGGYLALAMALRKRLPEIVLENKITPIAAISVGKVNGEIVEDLDYEMDSNADVDLNLVMNSQFEMIEIQGTGEKGAFSTLELNQMIDLGKSCIEKIFIEQEKILKNNNG